MNKMNELYQAVESLVADAAIKGMAMREYHERMGHVKSLAGQVFNQGRSAGWERGWDAHAQMVRERLSGLDQILMTAEEFKNVPAPEVEPFDE